jgi:hypothetical protein
LPAVRSNKFIILSLLVGLLGGLFFVFYFFNPSQHSFFLPCPFKLITGYHCPGCGSQRAIHQLAHGNFSSAFGYNPLMVLSLPLLFYGFGIKIWNYLFATQKRAALFYSPIFIYGYFGIVLIYWILRNLPFAPFNLLAPSV